MKKVVVAFSFLIAVSNVLGMDSRNLREESGSKVNSKVPLRENAGHFIDDEFSDCIKITLSELSGLCCPITEQEYPDAVRSILQQMAWSRGHSFLKELCNLIEKEDTSRLDTLMNEYPEIMKDQFTKDALLMLSTRIRKKESVKYIHSLGANLNVTTEGDYTPLICATKSNCTEIIEYLVNNGADVNALSGDQDTPIMWASKHNNYGVVKLLLEHRAEKSINVANKYGMTTALWCVHNNNLEMLEYLREHGADLNQKEKKGDTPLAFAAKNNNFEMVRYLVNHGANANLANNDGDTPVTLAGKNGNREMVKFLLEHLKPATAA